jgi:hypothetical protein
MVSYTTAPRGCLQWIFATLRIKDSRLNYLGFITDFLALLSPSQCKKLRYVLSLPLDVHKHPQFFSAWSIPCLCGSKDLLPGWLYTEINNIRADV